ncbi:Tetracycline resistance protein TetB/drug resistance transporter [Lasallia pustulata]|uniref:Tetracycline resistance protein TetB/drug resistance transporter n=1 Tax=Lasallia pustulata TaxID=136370 RepID=A0A1W5DCZ9_9LECA|nr:Tetracycline resistance protein TetB/drug resistance transporter [Lasallia pustulata]
MASTTVTSATREHSLEQEVETRQQQLTTASLDNSEKGSTQFPKQQLTDNAPTEEEHQWVTGIQLLTIMATICLVCFLMLLDTSIIVTAIPNITSDFHSLPDVGWYGSAYQLASATLLPLAGNLYTNFNSKWTFLTFFGIFELGSLLCGVATSSKMLIVGRAVAGIGTSGIQNGAFTIIAECVPMPKRPALIGFVMGVSQLGLVIGPLIGGALTQYTTWRWCFYINLPIGGLVAVVLFFVNVPEQMPKLKAISVVRTLPTKLDLIGFAIFAPAAIQLLLALQYGGNQFAWNSSTVIGLFCGAGATSLVFLAWDYYKGDAAMIPLSMIRKRTVWSSCLVYGFLMSQLFCTSYYLPIYFQGVKGVSPTLSGAYLLPSILSQLFLAVGSGTLAEIIG